jgi:DeoR/GlpR family transcriptional regulator of sugar metabolism
MSRSLTIDGDQLRRLAQICRYIGGGRYATFQQLQRKMRASRRTIFRDFKDLAEMGIRISLDGKGYCINQKPASCCNLIQSHQHKAVRKLLSKCM